MGCDGGGGVGWTRREFGGAAVVALLCGVGKVEAGGLRRVRAGREDGLEFLERQARRIVESARVAAGATVGGYHNATEFDLHVPGGNMGYPAFWVRDAAMMLGDGLVSAKEVEGWIRLICSTLRAKAWDVRAGVVVPAYTVPDHINFDGKATFYPGNYETGEKQGGAPWGKYPPLDDGFYFLMMVHEHWRLTGNAQMLDEVMKTADGEELLRDICTKVFFAVKVDEETGLVVGGDPDTENAKDWGFCDSVFKSGKLLFPSVLRFVAAKRMVEVYEAGSWDEDSKRVLVAQREIAGSLGRTFFRETVAGAEGWLHSATGVGNQADVWGSAFAVHSGVVDGETATKVSRALARSLREKTAFVGGMARHLPTDDRVNRGFWERSVSGEGEYQNGGYWGTPVGWCVSAIHLRDEGAAEQLAKDYVGNLRGQLDEDGVARAWEWENAASGKQVNARYVASVVLPLIAMREAGLGELLARVQVR